MIDKKIKDHINKCIVRINAEVISININIPYELETPGKGQGTGFFIDNNLNDEPLFIHFSGYNASSPVLTYPIYAQSTVDQNFAYSVAGFQGIIAKVTHDKQGTDPWEGNNGNGLLANSYYRL